MMKIIPPHGFIFLLIIKLGCNSEPSCQDSFTINGLSISFEKKGSGSPALIFLHGWAGHKGQFHHQVKYFSGAYQTVAVDFPGFGDSGNNKSSWTIEGYTDDIIGLMKHLKINSAVLIGHSMGGLVALEVAKKVPEKVIGIIPLDIVTTANVEAARNEEQVQKAVAYWMDWSTKPTYEKVKRLFAREIDSLAVMQVVDDVKSSSQIGWRESVEQSFRYMNTMRETLKEISVPIHCINKAQTKLEDHTIKQYNSNISTSSIEYSNHFIIWDAPDETNRLIESAVNKFLKKQ